MLTISLEDVEKIIDTNAKNCELNDDFWCPVYITINKVDFANFDITIFSINKRFSQFKTGEENLRLEKVKINLLEELEKYYYDFSLIFKNLHDSFEEDKNIKSLDDIVSKLKK